MAINEKVRAAILSLSSASQNAANLAARLQPNVGVSISTSEAVTDIESLKQQVLDLNRELVELRLYMRHYEDESEIAMTPEQEDYVMKVFTDALGTQAFAVPERVYDEEYMQNAPRHMRKLICTALVNWCGTRNFKPASLWYNVMVNNGSMQ